MYTAPAGRQARAVSLRFRKFQNHDDHRSRLRISWENPREKDCWRTPASCVTVSLLEEKCCKIADVADIITMATCHGR